jgi:hypothetical protein
MTMVRAPAKTCPNLSRLFHDAEPALLAAFLRGKVFARLSWLETYRFEPEDAEGVNGGVKTGHAAAQNQASGGVCQAPWRARSSDSWRVPWRIGPQGQFRNG